MEITANLLKLSNEWIVAQVEELEGQELLPGDPDCLMKEPFVIQSDGSLEPVSYTHLTLPTKA